VNRIVTTTVCVDAGMIWVGDPCYVFGSGASHNPGEWSEFCDKLPHDNSICEPLGKGVGVAIPSGYGDGEYTVDVEYSDEGSWGERVRSVTITFINDEDDDDDDDLYDEEEE
jgi:hypothetical protein